MGTITPDLPVRHRAPRTRRSKRRVFLWVFLIVQALFAVWLVTGAASTGSIHSDAVAWCQANHGFQTIQGCITSYGNGEKIGSGIGLGIIFVLWAVADIILGVTWLVVRLSRR